ncbi:unnamed protein product [Effrenium voratum]|nr:unnamed protein product [Effrenium voratum]
MAMETMKGRRSRGVRSRIVLTAIAWLLVHTVQLFTIAPHKLISPSRPGWKDSRKAQVTNWHPWRGGVALRASPQQDSDPEDWLAKSRQEVEAFGEEEVLSWAEAVLNEGKVRDELIQQTVTTLQQQGVTGKSLLKLTLEKLMAAPYNIPGGPAELLAEKIQLLKEPEAALMSGLKYRDPSRLLRTIGADWDYVGIEDLQKQLRKPLTELCQNKGLGEDKMLHPLFLVVAAPGQGKSRFLQEFHRLAEDTGLIGSSSYGQRFLQFLITLENGQKVDAAHDILPQTILASRMLWQLLAKADFTRFGWAGLPPNFTFGQLRAAVATEGILVDDVIQALEKGEGLSGAKWSLSLALDGLHNLPGSEDMSSKSTLFYQTMQAVCQQVNQDMGPLVVGVISATTRVGVESSLADSPQQRAFIHLPRVEIVQRLGKDVFNFSGNKILELVQSDMGGHGRALEQLEAIGIQDPRSAENVVQEVRVRLYTAYPNAIPDDFLPVLKAALAGKWLKVNEAVGGQNPEKLQLVQLEYSPSGKRRRLLLPYIWIHLAIVDEPQLQDWALLDYRDINDKARPEWL